MPGTGKEKSDKTGDKDLRKSERINKGDGSGEKVDLSLPQPLQLKERGAAPAATTSTPRMLDEEARLDKDIGEKEKSIHEAEKQLGEIVQKQRLQGKTDKLERLRQKLEKSQKKLKDAEEEARRPLTVTLISDSMAKHVCRIKNTVVQAIPGISITQMQRKIKTKEASINYKYLASWYQ